MLRWLWRQIRRPATPPKLTTPPSTTETPPWVDLSINAVRDELPTTQQAAAAWLAGLTTFSGLIAVAGVTVGTDALDGRFLLGRFDTYWVGITLIGGILATSAVATLSAVQANAVSWETGSTDPDKLQERWYTAIDTIRWYLTQSRRWTAYAVWFLMGYALLVLLSVKPEDPAKSYVRVTTGNGVYCGLLVTRADRKLAIHPRTGAPGEKQTTDRQGIELPGTVTDITPVSSCPANAVPMR